MARPIPPSRQRDRDAHHNGTGRFTNAEFAEVKMEADAAGCSVSAFIVRSTLEGARAHRVSRVELAAAHGEGRNEGRAEGFAEAQHQFQALIVCAKCGAEIVLIDRSRADAPEMEAWLRRVATKLRHDRCPPRP